MRSTMPAPSSWIAYVPGLSQLPERLVLHIVLIVPAVLLIRGPRIGRDFGWTRINCEAHHVGEVHDCKTATLQPEGQTRRGEKGVDSLQAIRGQLLDGQYLEEQVSIAEHLDIQKPH